MTSVRDSSVVASKEEYEKHILASWETGVGGVNWLITLANDGKATWDKSKGGYPWRFTARASEILSVITSGLPKHQGVWTFGIDPDEEYAIPPSWSGKVQLRPQNIERCPPDALLSIDAWDQS
ncbi:hypothetical protein RirG_011270 [Rhizophagus irregularis DAOM 197198w]|uniref:Uncharacterized protein n=1 Tax=Rhizophagus irregularis (strain DAOM 197198w) TaxID=1432141 RepID=A0A015M1I4_RHIIW|nr:hypothetical protein RirG_011270 [Rhizophagus irregularis DAOM 197198w]